MYGDVCKQLIFFNILRERLAKSENSENCCHSYPEFKVGHICQAGTVICLASLANIFQKLLICYVCNNLIMLSTKAVI